MRATLGRALPGGVLAAAVFVAVAVAATGVVRGSGRQIVDTGRYERYAEAMGSGLVPYRDFDFEYPPGALVVFAPPELVGFGSDAYFWVFAAQMAVLGAVAVLLGASALRRLGRRPRARWLVLALLALSPAAFAGVLLTRFDLVPAALLMASTLLLLSDRTRTASLALGAGAAVKLYPLVLLPLLVAWTWRRRGRREAIVSMVLALGVVALAYLPFVVVTPEGVASSLWRQLSRPLQVESVGAGLLILLDRLVDLELEVERSRGSDNLTGGPATAVAWGLSLAAMAAVGWLWLRFARGDATPERLVRYAAALLVTLVAFGKVLSPQFLLWLLFPLALLAGRRGAAAGVLFALAAVTTAVWFPALYFDLARERDPFVASLVVVRGLALLGVLLLLAWPRARLTAPRLSPPHPAPADAPP